MYFLLVYFPWKNKDIKLILTPVKRVESKFQVKKFPVQPNWNFTREETILQQKFFKKSIFMFSYLSKNKL